MCGHHAQLTSTFCALCLLPCRNWCSLKEGDCACAHFGVACLPIFTLALDKATRSGEQTRLWTLQVHMSFLGLRACVFTLLSRGGCRFKEGEKVCNTEEWERMHKMGGKRKSRQKLKVVKRSENWSKASADRRLAPALGVVGPSQSPQNSLYLAIHKHHYKSEEQRVGGVVGGNLWNGERGHCKKGLFTERTFRIIWKSSHSTCFIHILGRLWSL